MNDVLETQLMPEQDIVSWKLESKGKFSVKSTYNALTCSEGGPSFKYIRKGKDPCQDKDFPLVGG